LFVALFATPVDDLFAALVLAWLRIRI